eukprot:COSAG02_NODE_36227_length_457_cov_1.000000_1_plen_122_part_10
MIPPAVWIVSGSLRTQLTLWCCCLRMNIFGAYTAMSPLEVASVAAAAAAATAQDSNGNDDPLAKSGAILCQFKGKGNEFVRCHAYLGGGTLRLFDGHGHASTHASAQPSATTPVEAPVSGGT